MFLIALNTLKTFKTFQPRSKLSPCTSQRHCILWGASNVTGTGGECWFSEVCWIGRTRRRYNWKDRCWKIWNPSTYSISCPLVGTSVRMAKRNAPIPPTKASLDRRIRRLRRQRPGHDTVAPDFKNGRHEVLLTRFAQRIEWSVNSHLCHGRSILTTLLDLASGDISLRDVSMMEARGRVDACIDQRPGACWPLWRKNP